MTTRFFVGLLLAVSTACTGSSSSYPQGVADPTPLAADSGPQRGKVAVAIVDGTQASVASLQWAAPFSVRASGFLPGEAVTLQATANLRSVIYVSQATFAADPEGRIDTATMAPMTGDYTEADADGLMWSAKESKEKVADLPLWAFRVNAVASDGAALGTTTLARWYTAPKVVRTTVTDNGLDGVFYADPSKGRQPVIVAFGGSEGGLWSGEGDAAFWSSRGYAVLGLAYFAKGSLPPNLAKIPLEYFEKAFTWLDSRPEVDATRLAVMGVSRGGELALLLGATFPRIKAVVANVPSAVSWGAPTASSAAETASWMWRGTDLPWVPYAIDVAEGERKISDGTIAKSARPQFEAALSRASTEGIDAATFHVENTKGPILLIGGDDDQMWPSCTFVDMAMKRLTSAGHAAKYADNAVCYPESGHGSGGLPGVPTALDLALEHPLSGELLALGGNPRGIAHAQRDFLTRLNTFLENALKRP